MNALITDLWQLVAEKIRYQPQSMHLVVRLVKENLPIYWRRYLVAFVFMALTAASTAASAWIIKDIVDGVFVAENSDAILRVTLSIVAIFTIKGFARFAQEYSLSRLGNRIVADTQKAMYDKLLSLNVDYYQTANSGNLITRFTIAAGAVRDVLNLIAASLGRDLLTVIFLMAVMIYQDPLLSAIGFVSLPIAVVGVRRLGAGVRAAMSSEVQTIAKLISHVRDTVQGIRVIKAFGSEPVFKKQMYTVVDNVERLSNKIIYQVARTSPLMETLGGVAVASVIAYGGYRVLQEGYSLGSILSFVTAFLLAYEPVKRIARLFVSLEAGLVGVRLMYEVVDSTQLEEKSGRPALENVKGAVRYDGVTFGYRANQPPVINGVSLQANPGETIAIVGLSGSGKSTLLNLLLGYYTPWSGNITIDDRDISLHSRKSVRNSIAYVSQDCFLFEGSISDNIRFGNLDADEDEVIAAAKRAHAHEFIAGLSDGYAAPIGELGSQLSGGEKQRVAIARAMLRDAPIILLDEATSSLDGEAESNIREAIEDLRQGKTMIIIAHRLTTIVQSDRIYVLDNGAVVAEGAHGELISGDATYKRLFKGQLMEAGQ